MQDGQKIGGKATIPVGDMAKANLEKIFPQLTAAQAQALRDGTPVPPSPDWENITVPSVPQAPPNTDKITALEKDLEETRKVLQTTVRRSQLFDATMAVGKSTSSTNFVGVTAIMVFSSPVRARRARKAVNQFVAQSWPNKRLIIVNTSETPITNVEHPDITELSHPPASLSALRNFAMQQVATSLIFPFWDDDDVYDPDLLSYLMHARKPDRAVALTTQIRLDITNSVAYVHTEPQGIPNTLLCLYTPHKVFPEVLVGEDVEFFQNEWASKTDVIDNAAWPVNTLLMRVFDGNNHLPAELFMVDHATSEHYGRWELDKKVVTHIMNTMESFGMKVQADLPKEASQPATV